MGLYYMYGMIRKMAFILIAAVFTSCVYYNTFYNARQNFKRAEQNQRNSNINRNRQDNIEWNRAGPPQEPSISVNDRTLYKAAIDKANKVVVFYPNSKYADDAIWIIGKSRYNMTEHISCDKKLKELVIKYPKSEYVDDAYFYMGMSQFWLKNYELAQEAFNHINELKKTPYKDDAIFVVAYMDYIRGNFNSAVASFENFLKDYPKSDSSATAQFFIGVCHDSLGECIQAMQAYKNVDQYKPSHELYYDTRYAYGSTALRADSIDLGMSIFEDLSRRERYFDRSSMIRLKIADGKRLKGMIEEAESEYLKVIEQFPKTNQSAEAYYRLGLIYQNDKNDLTMAKKYFNDATREKRNSNFYSLALAKSAQISKLETYRAKLKRNLPEPDELTDTLKTALADDQSGQPDSLSTLTPDSSSAGSQPDSLGDDDKIDNTRPSFLDLMQRMASESGTSPENPDEIDQAITDFQKSILPENNGDTDTLSGEPDSVSHISDSLDSLVQDTISIEEDAEIRFLLAELYHHDLNRPDSALNEYLLLAETYPESEYTPKALLASAIIYEEKNDRDNARELYLRIINFYPSTEQARYAVTKIKGARIPRDSDVELMYRQAEDMYFLYNNPDSAIRLFDYIEGEFPQSEYAVKSAFSKAWIVNLTLKENGDSSAYHAFAAVVDKYPETPYAEDAKIRMGLVKRDTPKKKKASEEQKGDEKLSPQEDSLRRAIADSLRRLAVTLPRAPAVKDTGEFLYPEHLIGTKRRGMVTFKIRLDLFGNVVEHELLGPSGNDQIDSVATEALINTTFDMSNFTDLSMLDEFFRYDLRFEPPDYDDFLEDIYYDPDSPYRQQLEGGP